MKQMSGISGHNERSAHYWGVRVVLALIVLRGNSVMGQATWTYGTNTISASSSTLVGIGGTPLLNLDVIGASGQSQLFRIRSDFSNPTFLFQNDAPTSFGGGTMLFRTSQGTFAAPAAMGSGQLLGQMLFNGHDGSSYNTISSMIRATVDGSVSTGVVPGRIQFFTAPTGTANGIREVMRISANGNVGIGTTNPQNTLSVNGTIQAKEVVVNTGWADYVFKDGYRLAPLPEVANFIAQHGRLPEMPSEHDVKQSGASLGDMQVKLLAKIEELTLHMIEADKRNRELLERIARLEEAR